MSEWHTSVKGRQVNFQLYLTWRRWYLKIFSARKSRSKGPELEWIGNHPKMSGFGTVYLATTNDNLHRQLICQYCLSIKHQKKKCRINEQRKADFLAFLVNDINNYVKIVGYWLITTNKPLQHFCTRECVYEPFSVHHVFRLYRPDSFLVSTCSWPGCTWILAQSRTWDRSS